MSLFVDFTPAEFRAAMRRRAQIRVWIGAYVGAVLVLGGAYVAVTAGGAQRRAERDQLAAQLTQEWERNKEAQRLLKEIRQVEAAITRYDRLASPVRASDVVGTIGALLPDSVTLTGLTLTPRTDRTPPPPPKPGAKKTEAVVRSFLAIELEGIAPGDGDLAGLVSALERSELFDAVSMDYARSLDADGTPARSFRVSARVDLSQRFQFKPLAEAAPAPKAPEGVEP